MNINVKHKNCAAMIENESKFSSEEEVLVSGFTRFKINAVEMGDGWIEMELETLLPVYKSWEQWSQERKLREKFASYCFNYNFDGAIDLVKKNAETCPNLIN